MSETEKHETGDRPQCDDSQCEKKKRVKTSGKRPPKYYEFVFSEKFMDKDFETDKFLEDLITVLKDEHNLKLGDELLHGDIVNIADYRYTECYLVSKQGEANSDTEPDSEKLTFVKNPDTSSSGYLTIPLEVSRAFESGITSYMNAEWAKDMPLMIIETDVTDTYITSSLGTLPTGWSIEAHLVGSEIESIYLTSPQGDSTDYTEKEFSELTIEKLQADKADFKVTCILEGDFVKKHCEKHDLDPKKSYKIPTKKPDLLSGWHVEGGGSGNIAGAFKFSWKFHGPKESEQEMKNAIKEFMAEGTKIEFT